MGVHVLCLRIMKIWEQFLKLDGWHSEYPSVERVLRHYARRVKSEKTRANFSMILMNFCKFAEKNPDDLVRLSVKEASRLCQAYTDSLKDKNYSIRYVNGCQAYLRTFFKENDFEGSKALKTEHYYQPSRYRKKPEYIPTPEEVYKMGYASGSSKNRAMIFAVYTAGLRNSTVRAIRIGDVREELENGLNVVKVTVYPEMKEVDPNACKGNVPYYSFIDSTTVKAVREYLEERKERFGSIDDREPLFCSDSNKIPLETQRRTPVSSNGFERMVKASAKRAGVKKWKDVTPHCLRKTFESTLRNSGLDVKDQEFLMGHILPGSQDPYYDKTKVEDLRRKYASVNFFPQTGFISEEIRKRQLIDTARLLGFGDERIRRLEEVLARAKNVDEAIDEFKKLQEEPEDPPKPNSVKIVRGEKELIKHLEQGWRLIKELNHDKYVITH